jgi:glycosyltransferase involved in cell wall biosynthesis
MVVLEAMACGLPAIATTACGEISERVVEAENGFLGAACRYKSAARDNDRTHEQR